MVRKTPMHLPFKTFADVVEGLGDIPLNRIRFDIKPGKATTKDLLKVHNRDGFLFELVDGLLVEKAMGAVEGHLAMELGRHLGNWLELNDLGFLFGPDSPQEIMPDLVRIPDVSFISWEQCPNHKIPTTPIPELYPNLAVEILSEGNTEKEMKQKIKEYFFAGTQLVWIIDPTSFTIRVHTSPEKFTELRETESLNGDPVLPGFSLSIQKLFAKVDRSSSKAKGKKSKKKK
jgi:Uma2 family endonuclease